MALNVNKVFRFVQFVANKEHRGWISPSDFNLAAEIAQLTLYSEKESEYMQTKKVGAEMRPFVKKTSSDAFTTGTKAFPSNYRHLIRAYNAITYKPLKEVNPAELADIMDSSIVAPTASYPIIVERSDSFYVYPTDYSSDVIIEYLESPTEPVWGYTITSNRPVYASGSSTDFGFGDGSFLEISSRILEHVGINLGNTEISQYMNIHQKKETD